MRITSIFGLFLICFSGHAQNSLVYRMDLGQLKNDQLEINLKTPIFKQESVEFCFPKIVPGTYANYDFGRFISQLKAYDLAGKELEVTKKNVNNYQIKQANKLRSIRYVVDDSWDSPEINGEYVFEPAGTSFQKDTLFALNTHGILGYFKGFEKNKISVEITHPSSLFGSTSLKNERKNTSNTDIFNANSYQDLVDAPLMYAQPDTVSIHLGKAEILVSVFTPNHVLTAAEVANKIKPLLEAQKSYLGGELPVKRYAFLIVLSDNLKNGSFGALEHAQSSFYYLPEGNADNLGQTIQDVCAHEFFHIVTPLNIHSEEIGNFNFEKPKMSKHLWMYEGLTEYAAHHVQLKYGIIDLPQFMMTIQEKWETMQMQFNDKIPFTEMSKKVLDTYKDQYSNVYQKGALLGFGLDLLLLKGSNGTYGTQQMMRDLAKIYGPNQSFKDDELFDKLVLITHQPVFRSYFKDFIEGTKTLPLNAWLTDIGYELDANKKDTVKTLGFDFQSLSVNSETKRAYIAGQAGINDFGKSMDLKEKDELIAINGLPVDLPNFAKNTQRVMSGIKAGDMFELEIARPNEKGGFQTFKLRAPFEFSIQNSRNAIHEINNPTEIQRKLRADWLNTKQLTK